MYRKKFARKMPASAEPAAGALNHTMINSRSHSLARGGAGQAQLGSRAAAGARRRRNAVSVNGRNRSPSEREWHEQIGPPPCARVTRCPGDVVVVDVGARELRGIHRMNSRDTQGMHSRDPYIPSWCSPGAGQTGCGWRRPRIRPRAIRRSQSSSLKDPPCEARALT